MLEGNESVKEEGLMESTVPEYCLFFAETAPQVVSRGAKEEVKDTISLVFSAIFDTGKLRRHGKGADSFMLVLQDSGNGKIGRKVSQRMLSRKKTVHEYLE